MAAEGPKQSNGLFHLISRLDKEDKENRLQTLSLVNQAKFRQWEALYLIQQQVDLQPEDCKKSVAQLIIESENKTTRAIFEKSRQSSWTPARDGMVAGELPSSLDASKTTTPDKNNKRKLSSH